MKPDYLVHEIQQGNVEACIVSCKFRKHTHSWNSASAGDMHCFMHEKTDFIRSCQVYNWRNNQSRSQNILSSQLDYCIS